MSGEPQKESGWKAKLFVPCVNCMDQYLALHGQFAKDHKRIAELESDRETMRIGWEWQQDADGKVIAALEKQLEIARGVIEKIRSTNGLQYSDIFRMCDEALASIRCEKEIK